jgi:hypothetical protein
MVIPESERLKIEEKGGVNDRAVNTALQVAKEDAEFRGKIADFIMQGVDKNKFKEKLVEEALKDVELRKKIMLELIKKL